MNAMRALIGPRGRYGVNLHAVVARGLLLTVSTWTAVLQLWSSTSLAARAAGDSGLLDGMNLLVLALCTLGWIDVIVHDIGGRLLLPQLPWQWRHQVCVALYACIGLASGVRAFVAAGDQSLVMQVGTYYVLVSLFAMVEAGAIAREDLRAKGSA
jgi:hypothetical protein